MSAPCLRFRPAAKWGRERVKKGSQPYVKRGIGAIFSPVRFGSTPEITLYELKRGYNKGSPKLLAVGCQPRPANCLPLSAYCLLLSEGWRRRSL